MGRGNFTAKGADVGIAHIVGNNQDNIRSHSSFICVR